MDVLNTLQTLPQEMRDEIISSLSDADIVGLIGWDPTLHEIITEVRDIPYGVQETSHEQLMSILNALILTVVANYYHFLMGFQRPCLLSIEMSQTLGLDHYAHVNDHAIATRTHLTSWWRQYIQNHGLSQGVTRSINPDETMQILFGIGPDQISYAQFQQLLSGHTDCTTIIPMTPDILRYIINQ